MQVSIDVSLYPLNEKFVPSIDDFISDLKKYDNFEVRTNSMRTQLFGNFDDLIRNQIRLRMGLELKNTSILME